MYQWLSLNVLTSESRAFARIVVWNEDGTTPDPTTSCPFHIPHEYTIGTSHDTVIAAALFVFFVHDEGANGLSGIDGGILCK